MKAQIIITLKQGVLDPQGEAERSALEHLGFSDVQSVRQGKFIEVELEDQPEEQARQKVDAMCRKLLANTVIEKYQIELVGASS